MLFDVQGIFGPSQFKGIDFGKGGFAYADINNTGYIKRTQNLTEMINYLKGGGGENNFPLGYGPRFIKQLTQSIIDMNSQINDFLTKRNEPQP